MQLLHEYVGIALIWETFLNMKWYSLTDILFSLTFPAELEEKEDKFQQVVKQLEIKSQEALRYKTAAEVAKVTVF